MLAVLAALYLPLVVVRAILEFWHKEWLWWLWRIGAKGLNARNAKRQLRKLRGERGRQAGVMMGVAPNGEGLSLTRLSFTPNHTNRNCTLICLISKFAGSCKFVELNQRRFENLSSFVSDAAFDHRRRAAISQWGSYRGYQGCVLEFGGYHRHHCICYRGYQWCVLEGEEYHHHHCIRQCFSF